MRNLIFLISFLLCSAYCHASTESELLRSYLEPYTGQNDYKIVFTSYMGDSSNYFNGDSIEVSISKKGDSIYINQGSFEILQDGSYLVFANHLLKSITYTPLIEQKANAKNLIQSPMVFFNEILKDTLSMHVEESGSGKVFILNFDTQKARVFYSKAELYFNASGDIVKGVYYLKNDSKVITYYYKLFLTGENVDISEFNRTKFMINGQVSPGYSTYTLEKM